MKNTMVLAFVVILLALACEKNGVATTIDDMPLVEFRQLTNDDPGFYCTSIIEPAYPGKPGSENGDRDCEDVAVAFGHSQGFAFSSCKVSYDGGFDFSDCSAGGWPEGLTVSVLPHHGLGTRVYFTYESDDYKVGAVIVKGGEAANVTYYHRGGTNTGIDLTAPYSPIYNGHAPLSNLTFCFVEAADKPTCQWVEESAWAAGTRYVNKGNWATYTPYVEGRTIDLIAGKSIKVGKVGFFKAAPDLVFIGIQLDCRWRLKDGQMHVKIQDYAVPPPPKNPAPGLFAHQGDWGTWDSVVIGVPYNNYYGIHVSLEHEVCD